EGIKKVRPFIFKLFLFGLVLMAVGSVLYFKDQIFVKDKDVRTLDPSMIADIMPVKEIRYKDSLAKLTLQAGFLSEIPKPVLQTKCKQVFNNIGMFGPQQLYLLDEK